MSSAQLLLKDIYHFDIADYAVFSSMLLLSALTGLYFGCRGRYCKSETSQTLSEYLTGNKNLKPFPVALSLIASYVSGVTILGTPSEIYLFGTQYWLIIVAIWLSGLVVATVYLPVFLTLQVNSSYEYLELRFNRAVRAMASVLFILDEVMFLPIIIYVPSLAFNQVTAIDIHLIGTIVAVVCVFYTFLGGLKAVVWTDSWQVIAMFISVVVVIVLGTISAGGPSSIIDLTSKGNRFEFLNFTPSLYDRYSVLSVIVGGFTYWTCFNSVNQTMVQRYLSLPTVKQSKLSVLLFTIGVSGFVWMCCYAGILIYAKYYDCDPLSLGRIKADDQIFPLFVMETVGHLRGVPGLFIAGVFGAGLSSLSVVLNSTAQVVLEDFIKGCMRKTLSERKATIFVKGVVLILGVVAVAFMYVVEHMGGVLAMASSLSAIAAGTTCGIFTLGMLIPWANSKGALAGAIAGAIMSGTVSYGGQYVSASQLVVAHRLPVTVNGYCYEKYGISNETIVPEINYPDESNVFPLFRLSFLWITPVGVLSVLLVGMIVSYLTGANDLKTTDPELISPVMHWMLPPEAQRFVGSTIKKARNFEITEDAVIVQLQADGSLTVKFSKSHTLAEDWLRFKIFQDNLRKIEEHNVRYNNGEVSYFLKVNEFADWTSEEFRAMLMAQATAEPKIETIGTFKPHPNFTRPDSIDWREKNAVLEVKNQGNCGSCWAFSTTGGLEGQLAIHRNQYISLSEQELVSCSTANGGCKRGWLNDAYDYVKQNGLNSEEQYPYTSTKDQCRTDLTNKVLSPIQGYKSVDQDEDAIADAVATEGPISIYIKATQDWQLYGGGIFDHSDCDFHFNHAVLIVGYDSQAWTLKNSWGTSWGENGYLRLVRGKNQCGITVFPVYPVL